jgi:phenylacetate-CoA ligase
MMIIRGVNVFPTQIEEIILAEPGLAPYFQCVLSQPGNLLELTVLAESATTLGDADRLDLEKRIGKRIKDTIGTTAKIEVRGPGGIERSVGKARRIVDTRKSPFPT